MGKKILLDFKEFTLEAELFNNTISEKFVKHLPYSISLTKWGNELYGAIGLDLGEHNPVEVIPPGGIAYTNRGNLLCIFFGQRPAWQVEHIGSICGDQWKRLETSKNLSELEIRIID